MNKKIFQKSAEYYDLIYSDKNYLSEVNDLEKIWSKNKPESVLEIGCGTGNFTQILSNKGYKLAALDVSKEMIKIAKEKCNCKFIVANIKDFVSTRKYDMVIAMFNVIGYISDNDDLMKTFLNINKALKAEGLFIFDVWNGLAVLKLLPEKREKIVQNKDLILKRKVIPELKTQEHLLLSHYIYEIKEKNKKIKFHEEHSLRFFFPKEIEFILEITGFKLEKIIPLTITDNKKNKVDENIWNIQIVARKINDTCFRTFNR